MMHIQMRHKGVAFLGAVLAITSLLAGCTGVPGQDISPLDEQVPTENGGTSAGQVPGEGETPPPAQVPTKKRTYPTEPVSPPRGGSISETIAPVKVPEPIETQLLAEVSPAEGLTVELRNIEAIDATANAPGQIPGPALAVTIVIKNSGTSVVDTSSVEVSLEDADGNPGPGMIDDPADWFEGSIDPGAEASGVYVFRVAESGRDSLRVSFTLRPDVSAAVFTGSL